MVPKAEILRLGVLEQSKEEVIVQVSAKKTNKTGIPLEIRKTNEEILIFGDKWQQLVSLCGECDTSLCLVCENIIIHSWGWKLGFHVDVGPFLEASSPPNVVEWEPSQTLLLVINVKSSFARSPSRSCVLWSWQDLPKGSIGSSIYLPRTELCLLVLTCQAEPWGWPVRSGLNVTPTPPIQVNGVNHELWPRDTSSRSLKTHSR